MDDLTKTIVAMEAYLFLKASHYPHSGDPDYLFESWCMDRGQFNFEQLFQAAMNAGYSAPPKEDEHDIRKEIPQLLRCKILA